MELVEKDYFDYLEEMKEDVQLLTEEQFDEKYYYLCEKLTNKDYAEKIYFTYFSYFEKMIKKVVKKSVSYAVKNNHQAVLFQFDIENDFQSHTYIYKELDASFFEDEDWITNWSYALEGPSMELYGDIYRNVQKEHQNESTGVILYLLARTCMTFKRAVNSIKTKIAICFCIHEYEYIVMMNK